MWMRQSSVFEVGHHHAIAVKGRAQARPNCEGQDTGMVTLTGSKTLFCYSNGVCVVDQGHGSPMKGLQGVKHRWIEPCLPQIRRSKQSTALNHPRKADPDGPVPVDRAKVFSDAVNDGLRPNICVISLRYGRMTPSGLSVNNGITITAASKVNAENMHPSSPRTMRFGDGLHQRGKRQAVRMR